MSKISKAISQMEQLNSLNMRDQWVNKVHSLVKLSLTVFYIVTVVSFQKYMLTGLIAMCIYPIFVFNAADLSFKDCLYRLRIILPIVIIVGIFNPIFDRQTAVVIMGVAVSGGWLSMISLMIKGVLTVLAVYILVATTSIEGICYGLQLIHVPTTIITVVLLIYRYLFMLFKEVDKVTIAYKMRAPGQKGIHYRAWGSLVGQILIRTLDRATNIYESMEIRGFKGRFASDREERFDIRSVLFLIIWVVLFILIRWTNVIELIGGLI